MISERRTDRGDDEHRSVAFRCFVALRTLDENGPTTVHGLIRAIAANLDRDSSGVGLLFEDVQTIAAAGWIEPQEGDSRRFALTARGREVLRRASEVETGSLERVEPKPG